jgi:hypothetical protein
VQSLQLAAEAHAMAQADPRIAALAASLLASNPVAVSSFAAANHVDKQTAAIMLAKQTQQPFRQMAGGGRPRAGEPVIVGEEGPEVFVPDMPGTIVPNPPSPMRVYTPAEKEMLAERERRSSDIYGVLAGNGLQLNPAAWDAWLESRPESENIEDWRFLLSDPRNITSPRLIPEMAQTELDAMLRKEKEAAESREKTKRSMDAELAEYWAKRREEEKNFGSWIRLRIK